MQCERYVWVHGEDRLCGQVVALHRWYDSNGTEHAACTNHVAITQRLWPVSDPPMPADLPTEPDPIDIYKSWTDAGYTEAELSVMWGRG